MRARGVAIVGAGIGGLAAALALAAKGVRVTLFERADGPGGKLREAEVGGQRIDAGPTVLTLRNVFDELFAEARRRLGEELVLRKATVLARHAWSECERLDLYADVARSAEAIGELAGPDEARGFMAFCSEAKLAWDTLEHSFVRAASASVWSLSRHDGWRGAHALLRIGPFSSLWNALGRHFSDRRLRQLFARYATYCGSSPFLAPATLMVVAHVESEGVWLVEGGMQALARALARAAQACGAELRYGEEVAEILERDGRAAGVRLASGERHEAQAVIANADAAALAEGWFGAAAARAVPPARRADRSLSAITWALEARAQGFPLGRHNVFFSSDYRAEFDELVRQQSLPSEPTVYVCAQDRVDSDAPAPEGPERLLCLVNAPPTGDRPMRPEEIEQCETRTFAQLARCGLRLERRAELNERTTPADFERRFPATGGALYGAASHGWRASFRRPRTRTRMPGLYLAGGSVHPGPGLPMAALSGRMAAASLLSDLASTNPYRATAMRGGISTR